MGLNFLTLSRITVVIRGFVPMTEGLQKFNIFCVVFARDLGPSKDSLASSRPSVSFVFPVPIYSTDVNPCGDVLMCRCSLHLPLFVPKYIQLIDLADLVLGCGASGDTYCYRWKSHFKRGCMSYIDRAYMLYVGTEYACASQCFS